MLPAWFKQEIPNSNILSFYKDLFKWLRVDTVCREAHCPNIGSCFKENCMTFMILGDVCTRKCLFCAVKKINNENLSLDTSQPLRIAGAIQILGLDYAVITSVTRDDLADGGADIFARTIHKARNLNPGLKIEVLIPDFAGNVSSLEKVVFARPDCLAHNLETVPRLYKNIRPQANYRRSLYILKATKEINPEIITKSSLILGLGETHQEILEVIEELFDVGCSILTLGQYLSPSEDNYPVQEFIHPQRFKIYEEFAKQIGFKAVASAPLVRSSFKAKELYYSLLNISIDRLQKNRQPANQLIS